MILNFKKKNKISTGVYMGGSVGGSFDPSTLKFVPYNPDNETVWDIPDKSVNVIGLTSTGDIVAKAVGSLIFAADNTDQAVVTSLYQMEDVEAPQPMHGDTLVYNAEKGMYVSDNNLMNIINDLQAQINDLKNGNNTIK